MLRVMVALAAGLAGALVVALGWALLLLSGRGAGAGAEVFGFFLLLFSVGVIGGSLAGLLILRYRAPELGAERLLRLSLVAVLSAALASGAFFVLFAAFSG